MKWIGLGTPPAASRDDSASPGASERQVRGERFMTQRCVAIAVTALALTFGPAHVSAAGDEWTSGRARRSRGSFPEERSRRRRRRSGARVVPRDEKDKDGNPITSAFLEQDDGSLIPLPCQKKDKGIAGKAAGKIGGDDSCWKYVGEKVEIVGTAQSITKDAKRIRRLTKITGIKPF
jgi:hypothetical protein